MDYIQGRPTEYERMMNSGIVQAAYDHNENGTGRPANASTPSRLAMSASPHPSGSRAISVPAGLSHDSPNPPSLQTGSSSLKSPYPTDYLTPPENIDLSLQGLEEIDGCDSSFDPMVTTSTQPPQWPVSYTQDPFSLMSENVSTRHDSATPYARWFANQPSGVQLSQSASAMALPHSQQMGTSYAAGPSICGGPALHRALSTSTITTNGAATGSSCQKRLTESPLRPPALRTANTMPTFSSYAPVSRTAGTHPRSSPNPKGSVSEPLPANALEFDPFGLLPAVSSSLEDAALSSPPTKEAPMPPNSTPTYPMLKRNDILMPQHLRRIHERMPIVYDALNLMHNSPAHPKAQKANEFIESFQRSLKAPTGKYVTMLLDKMNKKRAEGKVPYEAISG
ncbi:hypothetical protein BU23DRAFT_568946 [Bimuria novae-zelandiae CBS 107.79]|uniref:Uncharacterized protein n=1 Tax=Bimuria novae-zelandiae CBS 107.79 TaxID=1447943 RepID=A0A6A5V7E1_9PLEO|nr:hypothetical protein BU23DRAFT_568946 [Bimuria novae-zelandiae CBS 107.79]